MSLLSRRQLLLQTMAHGSLLGLAGCGTVLHPERRGQPAGPLDWKIVALDTLGLLMFFVPGVIAFAVDFNNGTIYLPHDPHSKKRDCYHEQEFATISIPREDLSVARLEQVISRHADRDVTLKPGTYRTRSLKSMKDFWTVRHEYHLS